MKKFMTGLCAAALMAATFVTGVVPAQAQFGEAIREGRIPPGAYVDNYGGERIFRGDRRAYREFRRDRRDFRREARRDFYRDGGYGYYRGYRGYPRYRRGYREYNGLWFPLAAFAAGAVIGGAINDGPVVRRSGGDHYEWCRNRYRSYRAADNTFQPYNGPRQQCYSPYS